MSLAEVEGDWTYSVSNNEATITDYQGEDWAITIPSALGGCSVKSLGGGFATIFGWGNIVASVRIPASVTNIVNWAAFDVCPRLSSYAYPLDAG